MDQWTALLICLGVEVPLAAMFAWSLGWVGRTDAAWTGLVALSATCLTQPSAWFFLQELGATVGVPGRVAMVWLAVTVLEGLAYAFVLHLGRRKGLALSLMANGAALVALMGSAGLVGWVP